MIVQKLSGPGIVCLHAGNGHGYLQGKGEVLDSRSPRRGVLGERLG